MPDGPRFLHAAVRPRCLRPWRCALLLVRKRRGRGQIDPHLAIARAKIEDAETFDEALGYLTARETFAVLNSPTILRAVCTMPRGNG